MFRIRNIRNLSHYSRRVNVFGGHCVGFGVFRPLLPVSDTETGFDPLSSRDLCKTYRHSRVGGNLQENLTWQIENLSILSLFI